MTDRNPSPLPIRQDDELDIQIGTGLVTSIADSGIRKICELRSRLAQGEKQLPLVRVRDNATFSPISFLLNHDGRLAVGGDFATIGDILHALSLTAVHIPPTAQR